MFRCTFLEEKQEVVHLNVFKKPPSKKVETLYKISETKMQFSSLVPILFYGKVMLSVKCNMA